MALVRWDPVRELDSLQADMNRLFDRFFGAPDGGTAQRRWIPAMDLIETDDSLVLRADLPGVNEDDVEIEVKDGVLTISGERKAEREEKGEGFHRVERSFGRFSRSLNLPEGVDARQGRGQLRQRRARGTRPEARGAQPTRVQIGKGSVEGSGEAEVGIPHPTLAGCETTRPGSGSRSRPVTAPPARASSIPPTGRSRTPAFIPLATKGERPRPLLGRGRRRSATRWCSATPSTCTSRPGEELIAGRGGLHGFMGWERRDHHRLRRLPGLLARPRRRRRRDQGAPRRARGRRQGRDLRGGRRASSRCSTAPTASSARRSRWRSRRRSAPTSRSPSTSARRSTPTATTPPARPSAPTAGSTAASTGTSARGRARQAVFGIVQGGVHEDLRRESAERVSAAGGRRDRDRRHPGPREGGDARGARLHRAAPARRGAHAPARDRRGRRPPGGDRRSGSTSSTARYPPGSPGTGSALAPEPEGRFRIDLAKAPLRGRRRADRRGLPLRGLHAATAAPTSTTSPASKELTGARLLTLHNLTYMRAAHRAAREAIEAGDYAAYSDAVLGGAARPGSSLLLDCCPRSGSEARRSGPGRCP